MGNKFQLNKAVFTWEQCLLYNNKNVYPYNIIGFNKLCYDATHNILKNANCKKKTNHEQTHKITIISLTGIIWTIIEFCFKKENKNHYYQLQTLFNLITPQFSWDIFQVYNLIV